MSYVRPHEEKHLKSLKGKHPLPSDPDLLKQYAVAKIDDRLDFINTGA